MKALVCSVCGHVALNGVAPDNCPICHAPKDKFIDKEDALKVAADPANLTEAEQKHTPVIVVVKECGLVPAPCKDVHVKVGSILHPMTPEHGIRWIDFYINKEFISRVSLFSGEVNPAVALHVKAQSGTISVVEFCNLHGSWISEAAL